MPIVGLFLAPFFRIYIPIMKLFKRLEIWLLICISTICLFQLIMFAYTSQHLVSTVIEQRTGRQALAIAQAVASEPSVVSAMEVGEFSPQLIERLDKLQTDADLSFIVIGDTNRIRIYHPDRTRIGLQMQGGDSLRALQGESYISKAVGSLGPSIRGKVPIYSANNEVIGLVSVGVLQESVELAAGREKILIFATGFFILLLAVFAAQWIAMRVRRKLFGLQPDEIGRLYAEQEAMLNTVRTGILALDIDGTVRKINQRGREILCSSPNQEFTHLKDLLPQHAEFLLTDTSRLIIGFELFANNQWIVLSRLPLQVQGQTDGILISMRPADEIEHLSQQLAKVQAFAELLRVQTHDYSNKLNTLGALIQMEKYDKALELIGNESRGFQDKIHALLQNIEPPVLAALVFGKYLKARELNINLDINPESELSNIDDKHKLERLVSMLGNLIDNAIEAVQRSENPEGTVRLSLEEVGSNLVFEVEDSGDGIKNDQIEKIFVPTFSSKSGAQHGVGMYLVKTYLNACNGNLEIADSDLGGARFTLYIPKASQALPELS